MIPHLTTVHHHYTVSGIYFRLRSNFPVFKGYHDRSRLECRPRFHHIANGIITHFIIVAVTSFHHVDDSFDFTCFHFHQYGYTYSSIDFFQLIHQCFLADILHTYIESGDNVAAIYGSYIYDVQVFIHHFLAVRDTVTSFQQSVKSQFDTILCPLCSICIEVTQCTGCQGAKRLFTLIIYLFVETAFVFVQIENRQTLGFFVLDV